jgi:hypothetical protein
VSGLATRVALALALVYVAQSAGSSSSVPLQSVRPLVCVWYRGTPAGTPVAEELAVIRALGFGGVVWPGPASERPAGGKPANSIEALTEAAGLKLIRAAAPQPATPQSVMAPPARVDLIAGDVNAGILTALAWRAVAHGARVLAFDGHVDHGAGLENPDRSLKPWAHAAIDVARQFSLNERFIVALAPGPGVITTPDLFPALDVSMLDTGRSWVVIATNTSSAPVTATVRLPDGTPYAIWLDVLDGSTLAMNGAAAAPRWDLKLDARSARVYMIEKIKK